MYYRRQGALTKWCVCNAILFRRSSLLYSIKYQRSRGNAANELIPDELTEEKQKAQYRLSSNGILIGAGHDFRENERAARALCVSFVR